ncbi:MAG: signal recognition particle protein [candidate division WOR-3 bacterium]|nr:MAG: signal recognition particle protein [candidate division WOR-3 bacterium]
MFEGLIEQFQLIKRKALGYGRITTSELDGVLRDIRISLLEADVNYKVVKEFIEGVRTKCLKIDLSKSLKPGELVIKAVYEELISILGTNPHHIQFTKDDISVISLIGLQGVGKTTTAAKLAVRYKSKNPLLVPADAKRPAAVQQLKILAERVHIPFFPLQDNSARETVKEAKEYAHKKSYGLIIIDTAGRLHIDADLVRELVEIDRSVQTTYRLLVADGMTGQDAVKQAEMFKDKVGLQGAILTKMDGDARGGAALSIVRATDVPIFFICTSEQLDGIEVFYPDRMAQRILGMGDVASLVEKVKGIEEKIDHENLRKKVMKGELDLEDFLTQLRAVKGLGPIRKLASMIPGVKESDIDEKEFKRVEAIIQSMTKRERRKPDIIDGARKRRIAAGSGTTVADVNQLLKQFFYARDLLKKAGQGNLSDSIPFRL